MSRAETLSQLSAHLPHLANRFGIASLALFGSMARDQARPDSDIDILACFDGPATSARYFGVLFYLEDLLGCPIDLVTDKALRAELKPFIEKEMIYVKANAAA
ncbi:Nucleotidyltransferase domain protein [Thiorhodovibrio winogradskyi]|uniref:Nucleotidyltransferase domain protein n=2 Tax=Thiorhodovibrio winogradskyi TaxID=77007 RepID=A0ABZ0SDG5_9GAMM